MVISFPPPVKFFSKSNSATDDEALSMANVALQIHTLLGIHRTSIVERHMPPPGQYTLDGAYPGVMSFCATLSKCSLSATKPVRTGFFRFEPTTTGSSDTRVSALKAIIALTVEDPCAREAFKKIGDALQHLTWLSEHSSVPAIKTFAKIAVDAIKNQDDVHQLWSTVITEPVNLNDMRGLLNDVVWNPDVRKDLAAIANDDMQIHKPGLHLVMNLVRLDGAPEPSGSESRFGGDRKFFQKLAKSLGDPTSSYVAGLYVDHAIKLARDGPSERAVHVIVRHLRHVLSHHKTSIVERHSGNARVLTEWQSTVEVLCLKLLKYVTHASTTTSAMKEVISLAVDDPYVREELKRCMETSESLWIMIGGSNEKVWEEVLCSINRNAEIHKLWSEAIKEHQYSGRNGNASDNMLRPSNTKRRGSNKLAGLIDSLCNPKSERLAEVYFERLEELEERGLKEAYSEAQRVLGHHKMSYVDRAKVMRQLPRSDDPSLPRSIKAVLCFARNGILPSTRISALKVIIALAIEEFRVRESLREMKTAIKLFKESGEKAAEIRDTISTILDIIRVKNEALHRLWKRVVAETEVLSDVKQLEHEPRIAENCTSLKEFKTELVNSGSKYLTTSLYVGHAMEAMEKEGTSLPILIPTTKGPEKCEKCGTAHSRYRMSSEQLFQYVLRSAPHGSLKNLTGSLNLEGDETVKLGDGGFANVYKTSMKSGGKSIAVKILKLSYEGNHCQGHPILRNFARELRILAQLSHPNVLSVVGYMLNEEKKQYCIVTECMEGGNLQNRMGNLSTLELLQVSLDIAQGMCYLHEKKIVHGDLKTPNVLVSPSGAPVLADFGLARMAESFQSKGFYSTATVRTSKRWVPYEFYENNDEKFCPDMKSDVWSFGMTLLELLTLEHPFAYIESDGAVAKAIVEKRTPLEGRSLREKYRFEKDYEGLEDDLWCLCRCCWTPEKDKRPSMQDVLHDMIKTKYRRGIAGNA